jgi:hypothetical protein
MKHQHPRSFSRPTGQPNHPANLVAYAKYPTSPATQAVLHPANPSARGKDERRRMIGLPRRPRHGRGFLFCRALTVANPVPLVANMYSNKKDSMTIPISVHMWHKKTETKVLLDSGATHNFIDKRAVNSLGLGTRSLPHPLQVNNVDGSLNQEGNITQYCNLWICQKDKTVKLGFYVANLGSDRIIFGHPWFKTFNPPLTGAPTV